MERGLEILPGEGLANIQALFDYYVATVNGHFCYNSNLNAHFKAYRFPWCDQMINKCGNLESTMTTCRERASPNFPKIVYQHRETLFDTIGSWSILHTANQKVFNKRKFLNSNYSLCKKKVSRMPKEQHVLGRIFQFRCQCRPLATGIQFPMRSFSPRFGITFN